MDVLARPIYLDTNIFIFASEELSERGDLLNRLFSRSFGRQTPAFATSELTISELLVRPFQQNDTLLVEEYQRILTSSPWLMVTPISRDILEASARLRSDGTRLKLPDAIHVATAMTVNARHILTADEGIRFAGSATGVTTSGKADDACTVLRPDIPTLTTLLESLAS